MVGSPQGNPRESRLCRSDSCLCGLSRPATVGYPTCQPLRIAMSRFVVIGTLCLGLLLGCNDARPYFLTRNSAKHAIESQLGNSAELYFTMGMEAPASEARTVLRRTVTAVCCLLSNTGGIERRGCASQLRPRQDSISGLPSTPQFTPGPPVSNTTRARQNTGEVSA